MLRATALCLAVLCLPAAAAAVEDARAAQPGGQGPASQAPQASEASEGPATGPPADPLGDAPLQMLVILGVAFATVWLGVSINLSTRRRRRANPMRLRTFARHRRRKP
jgi:hypothetical protein